ncbi:MAG: hypothetical protein ABIQ86_11010 [Steroidobacteraceae bacterium]
MYLIQILLPLYDNSGKLIPELRFRRLSTELAARFGGLTAYTHSPAEGLWKRTGRAIRHDEVVVYEVMSDALGRAWWSRKRAQLEKAFGQESIVVRAHRITRL